MSAQASCEPMDDRTSRAPSSSVVRAGHDQTDRSGTWSGHHSTGHNATETARPIVGRERQHPWYPSCTKLSADAVRQPANAQKR
jgi:hypothetical protein